MHVSISIHIPNQRCRYLISAVCVCVVVQRSKVLTDAVNNMVAMSGNLLSDGITKDPKTGMTGMEAKVRGLGLHIRS